MTTGKKGFNQTLDPPPMAKRNFFEKGKRGGSSGNAFNSAMPQEQGYMQDIGVTGRQQKPITIGDDRNKNGSNANRTSSELRPSRLNPANPVPGTQPHM